ncbi:amino acid ABC transporter permease [Janibacter terrae]|uniref:Amino acid ABC transporter permease n=1 Tax=Janibacter terrae TaxID=103817 RepID=A0ABZ2FBM2_9MICO|nr:amino acid ABC transporter permease [Janibacter terrae]MBA4083928.1 amino acid ABC transporter permease [Kytococcus sp.]HCE60063.1 amino acid ABC transporter permease [Janibacter terrae]
MSTSTVLFDNPGPRARVRYRIVALLGLLVAAGILWVVVGKLNEYDEFSGAKWSPMLEWSTWRYYLLLGLWNTLKAAGLSVVGATLFGLVFGTGRLSGNRVIRWVSGAVVEFFRAIPVLIMMIFFFGIYAYNGVFSADLNPLAAVVTALTLYNGSVMAELLRSGVHSLPSGQSEAGLSVGLSRGQVLRSIQIPQAVTAMLPALVSQLVVILKDTALGTVITYPELLQQGQNLSSLHSNIFAALVVVAIMFIVVNWALTSLAGLLERRINRRGRTAGDAIAAAPTVPGAED